MTAFSSAWSLLKNEPKPVYSVEDIRDLRQAMQSEKDTGVYDVNRGKTSLEQLMGIFPLRQKTFDPSTGELNPYGLHEDIDKRFLEGYKKRMDSRDTPSRSSPAKVVRIPDIYSDEFGQAIAYELQDEEGNTLSRVGGKLVEPNQDRIRYTKHIENALPMLYGLHGRTPKKHQRQGYYQQLLNTILHNNMNILSSSRNQNSQPFHESFQRRLPPSIDFDEIDAERNKEHVHGRKYLYQPNPIKQSKEREKYRAAGYGDLLPDYGILPMVDEPEDERITNMKRDFAQGYLTQTRLDDERFLPERDVEHPRHRQGYPYFKTKYGRPYSTNDVLSDPYNDEYEGHPGYKGLGHLFG